MTDPFPWALVVIPLVLLLTVAGLFLLARSYQARATLGLDRLRLAWRKLETAYSQALTDAQPLLEDPEEPYLSLARRLRGLLDALDRTLSPLRDQRIALKQRANDLAANPFRAIIGAPYLWYLLDRDIRKLEAEMQRAFDTLYAASAIHEERAAIAWRTAEAVRATADLLTQTQSALSALTPLGLQGPALDEAHRQAQQTHTALRRLPPLFTTAPQEEVLAQAAREDVISAHAWHAAARPALESLLNQAQSWQQSAQAAHDRVAALRKVLDDIDQTLDTLPKSIDVADASRQLDGFQQVYNTLHATLSRLEADSSHLVAQEADKLVQSGHELASSLKRARRDQAALELALAELPAASKDLTLRITTLAAKTIHPLKMTTALDQLAGLSKQSSKLGSAGRKRTPEAIAADLRSAADLRTQQKELAARLTNLEEAHLRLEQLIQQPPLANWQPWLEEASRTARQAADYAPENWSRADSIPTLPDEIARWRDSAAALDLAQPAASIDEAALPDYLASLTSLLEDASRFDKRLASLRTRLQDLQSSERQVLEKLEAAERELAQMEVIIRSSELLSSLASQEAERLQRELDSARAALADRRQGALERKTRSAEQVIARIETAANAWLAQLHDASRATVDELTSEISTLDQIAPLEEAALDRARQLVEQAPAHRASGRGARPQFPLPEVAAQLRQNSQYAESLGAALNSLADFHPLIDAYADANHKREEARVVLAEATSAHRSRRAWPPSTVSFDAENQERDRLEGEWTRLKESSTRAMARVQSLGKLGAQYQALHERVANAEQRAAFEAAAIDDLLSQIDSQADLWNRVYDQLQDNPTASSEIGELLQDANRTHDAVQRKYKSGAIDYNGVVDEFKKLLRKMTYFQAQVDDQTAVDNKGNLTRRKESSRQRFN